MQYLTQPPASKLCGQTCVAMVADIDLDAAIALVGHSKGTTTKQLTAALRKLGYVVGDRLLPIRNNHIPDRAICKLRFKSHYWRKTKWSGNWHWVLVWDGVTYDPAGPDARHPKGCQLSSYIDLTHRILKT